uniref:Uncharacterized protein n=1 Tax=Anopheles melas TaxID=34690 RepID=A0A182TSC6_9DIPT
MIFQRAASRGSLLAVEGSVVCASAGPHLRRFLPRTINSSIEEDSSSEATDDGATEAGRLANGLTGVMLVGGLATTAGATLMGMYLVGTVIKIGVAMMVVGGDDDDVLEFSPCESKGWCHVDAPKEMNSKCDVMIQITERTREGR